MDPRRLQTPFPALTAKRTPRPQLRVRRPAPLSAQAAPVHSWRRPRCCAATRQEQLCVSGGVGALRSDARRGRAWGVACSVVGSEVMATHRRSAWPRWRSRPRGGKAVPDAASSPAQRPRPRGRRLGHRMPAFQAECSNSLFRTTVDDLGQTHRPRRPHHQPPDPDHSHDEDKSPMVGPTTDPTTAGAAPGETPGRQTPRTRRSPGRERHRSDCHSRCATKGPS